LQRWKHCETIQSTRDKNYNATFIAFRAWLSRLKKQPEWLVAMTATIAQWQNPRRLVGLVLHWRDNRFKGDTMFETMEEWRKQDKHLYDWACQQRRGEERWRQDMYRNIAAQLARAYRVAVIEATDWTVFCKNPKAEKDDGSAAVHRWHQRIAAVSYLNLALKNRFTAAEAAPPEYITLGCHQCGGICQFDAAKSLRHQCEHCGAEWDQDHNAAVNLLHRLPSNGGMAQSA
jgi:hypothetical protein